LLVPENSGLQEVAVGILLEWLHGKTNPFAPQSETVYTLSRTQAALPPHLSQQSYQLGTLTVLFVSASLIVLPQKLSIKTHHAMQVLESPPSSNTTTLHM
jgi:hypothetical protein